MFCETHNHFSGRVRNASCDINATGNRECSAGPRSDHPIRDNEAPAHPRLANKGRVAPLAPNRAHVCASNSSVRTTPLGSPVEPRCVLQQGDKSVDLGGYGSLKCAGKAPGSRRCRLSAASSTSSPPLPRGERGAPPLQQRYGSAPAKGKSRHTAPRCGEWPLTRAYSAMRPHGKEDRSERGCAAMKCRRRKRKRRRRVRSALPRFPPAAHLGGQFRATRLRPAAYVSPERQIHVASRAHLCLR